MRPSGARSWSPESTATSRAGIEAPGGRWSRKSKGGRRMLPNALQPNATDHIPVLAEEVRELLAVERGDTVVDATFGAGGHAELLAADLHGEGKLIAIDRDQAARTYFERFRRRTGVQSRFLRGEFATV